MYGAAFLPLNFPIFQVQTVLLLLRLAASFLSTPHYVGSDFLDLLFPIPSSEDTVLVSRVQFENGTMLPCCSYSFSKISESNK